MSSIKDFYDKEDYIKCDKKENMYPNCDVNVWLRSCEKEVLIPLEGKITGRIPKWLRGILIRNGPGSLKAGNDYFQHLFDASALLHRFAIDEGRVTYQCKFLQSEVYKKNWKANRIVVTEFGTKAVPDPCLSIFHRFASIFSTSEKISDNAMISVYPFGDEIYAFTETPIIHKINKTTLNTEKKINMTDNLAIVNHTSHPHVLENGTVYNLGMSFKNCRPHHNIICFPKADRSEKMFETANIVASIPARWPFNPSYMHTFGLTETYFVIVEQPLSISLPSVIKSKIISEPLAGCLHWYKDEYTQINIISRKTGHLVCTFLSEAFFYLHIINQYEMDDYIILDICCYKDASMLDCMYVEAMKNMQSNPDYAKMFRGRPLRFVLPIGTSDTLEMDKNENLVKLPNVKAKAFVYFDNKIFVQPELLCDLGCETPRIFYEKHLGKMYRYFYAISSDVDAENPGTLIKVDITTKTKLTWCEENCYPSEPIFVPSPEPKAEDDGVVIASMIWGKSDTNHVGLIILDAQTFTEVGRAEFQTPGPIPKCLHGWFLREK